MVNKFDGVWCFFAMTLGNYTWQMIFEDIPNYSSAFERSFFQGMAFLALFLIYGTKPTTK